MQIVRCILRIAHLALILGCIPLARAEEFPSKPLRILTTLPGGGSDLVARVSAQGLLASLGQPVVVDNRGGASAFQHSGIRGLEFT